MSAFSTQDDSECTICLGPNDAASQTLPCGHKFHAKCIVTWFWNCNNNRNIVCCPNCKSCGSCRNESDRSEVEEGVYSDDNESDESSESDDSESDGSESDGSESDGSESDGSDEEEERIAAMTRDTQIRNAMKVATRKNAPNGMKKIKVQLITCKKKQQQIADSLKSNQNAVKNQMKLMINLRESMHNTYRKEANKFFIQYTKMHIAPHKHILKLSRQRAKRLEKRITDLEDKMIDSLTS